MSTPIRTLPARIAMQVTWARIAAWVCATIAVGSAGWVVGLRLHAAGLPWFATAVTAALGGWCIARRPVGPRHVAAHLDRVMPQLEESAALLVDEDDSVLARLQRRRVVTALEHEPVARVPVPSLRLALCITGLAGVAMLVALFAPPRTAASSPPARAEPAPVASEPRIDRIALRWVPPRYTGRRAMASTTLNVIVEEQSVVTWRVAAPGASRVRVVTSAGDTLRASQGATGEWNAQVRVDRPLLWRIEVADDATTVRGDDHLVSVTPDRPPLVAVVAPPSRVAIEWAEPHALTVRALVSDDYGLGAIRLIATVASGSGEGVKFRERTLAVETEARPGPASVIVSRNVDLDSLGVVPGDEVLLAFEAADRREPSRQVSRSETIFVTVLDTIAPSGALPGIALRAEPSYFRSQRQIILDTEALLRDIRRGAGGDTLRRSMDIGYDQYLLRVRYGALVGDENEGAPGEADPVHADDAPVTAEDFRHNHDMAENATLLGASVKALLKRSLTSMWEAEKLLRTGHPAAALPHEYRALESLEEIRRASRAYVKRIGFEPPAIDVERTRFSREPKGLASLESQSLHIDDDPDAGIRRALAVLAADGPVAAEQLADAGRRIAALAIDVPAARHLETLRLLRQVSDGCVSCRAPLRAALLAALPVPDPALRSQRPVTRSATP